ncbi:MAG TPA: CHASE3 domain-containing protein, partial [Lysobacter sp.]
MLSRTNLKSSFAPLLAGIVLIVLGPFVVQRALNERSYQASVQVAHNYEVEAAAQAVVTAVRDTESAALALALGIDTPLVRERLARGLTQSPLALDRLEALTQDNPSQQVRIGRLRDRIGNRMAAARAIGAAEDPTKIRALAADMTTRSVVAPLAGALIEDERRLTAQRTAEAQAT